MWPFHRRHPASDPPDAVDSDGDGFEDHDGQAPRDGRDARVVRLRGLIDDALSNEIIQRLLFYQYEDPRASIVLDIDSRGGSVAGTMAVVDTIGVLDAPVHTRCTRRATGGAAIILAAGTRGNRTVGPQAALDLVPVTAEKPSADQRALERDRDLLTGVLARLTGRPHEEVSSDLTAGRKFNAAAAVEYGLADTIDVPADVSPAEAAWLAGDDPVKMLEGLTEDIRPRKAVLFGVACRRRVEAWDYYKEAAAATDTAELLADGQVTTADCQRAYEAVFIAREGAGRMILGDPDGTEPNDGTAGYYALEAAANLLHLAGNRRVLGSVRWSCSQAARFGDHTPDRTQGTAELRAQAGLVRCLFGNPYRPVPVDRRWRTADVVGLARGIYEDRAFDRLALLADALMDAGCDNEQVLGHCRSEGPHSRGCWVIDQLLGKE
jgi:ATP-dependent Clp endopeptidase proteolytic subunit ClpP